MRAVVAAPGLTRRRLLARPTAALLLGLLILLTAAAGALVPRALDRLATVEVADRLAALGPVGRSLQGSADFPENWPADPPPSSSQIFGDLAGSLGEARDRLPQPLRSGVGTVSWIVETSSAPIEGARRAAALQLAADPGYRRHVRLVAGTPPATWEGTESDLDIAADPPVDIAIPATAARALGLHPGSVLLPPAAAGSALRYRVSGLYAPIAGDQAYALGHPELFRAEPVRTADQVDRLAVGAFVAPETVGRLAETFRSAHVALVLPLRTDAWDSRQAAEAAMQLAGLVNTGIPVSGGETASLSTGALDALDAAAQRSAMFSGLIALLASAPLGVLVAVLVVAAGAVLRPWRADLALVRARGGGALQLRLLLAVVGLSIAVPASALGAGVAIVATPGPVTPADLAAPVLAALAPAALFAASVPTRRGARIRSTLRRFAGVGTAVLAVLALVALGALVARGLAASTRAVGIDPLPVATPLLLALAAAVLVLRVTPALARVLAALARRGRGAVGLVGAARGARRPIAGAAGVLAIVVGISTALFSATMLGTIDRAVDVAARAAVGADARIDGDVGGAELARMARLPGVRAVAGVQHVAGATVQGPHVLNDTVSLLLAPTAGLRRLRGSVPPGMATERSGRVPVAVSADLRGELALGDDVRLAGVPARIVGVLPADDGLGPSRSWVLVDASFALRLSGAFRPDLVLIRADAGAPGLLDPLRRIAGPGAAVTTIASELTRRHAEPVVVGARTALLTATIAPAALAAIAIVLSVLAASGARRRTAGILRSLGMPRRGVRALVAWELAPPALVALVAGTGAGAALSAVLVSSIDLVPFVGAGSAPVAPAALTALAIVGGFSVIAFGAGLLALITGDGRHPVRAVRMGAE